MLEKLFKVERFKQEIEEQVREEDFGTGCCYDENDGYYFCDIVEGHHGACIPHILFEKVGIDIPKDEDIFEKFEDVVVELTKELSDISPEGFTTYIGMNPSNGSLGVFIFKESVESLI